MMIYVNDRSRKVKKPTKQSTIEYQAWLDSVNTQRTSFSKTPVKCVKKSFSFGPKVPPGRETPRYPSVDSGGGSTTKPIHGKVYTGSLMKGIGTLHKSNAVPIFTDEEARDQASMRR
jgi:hypothetical protein